MSTYHKFDNGMFEICDVCHHVKKVEGLEGFRAQLFFGYVDHTTRPTHKEVFRELEAISRRMYDDYLKEREKRVNDNA